VKPYLVAEELLAPVPRAAMPRVAGSAPILTRHLARAGGGESSLCPSGFQHPELEGARPLSDREALTHLKAQLPDMGGSSTDG
jgi:hypothetical protein